MPRKPRPAPSTLVEDWPEVESTRVAVEVARQLARRLARAMEGHSAREVGRWCGVDHTTVLAILHGTTWPDLMTIASLESGLGVDLWPHGLARQTATQDRA